MVRRLELFLPENSARLRHSWDPGGSSRAPRSVSQSQERLSSTGPLQAASLWVWRPLGQPASGVSLSLPPGCCTSSRWLTGTWTPRTLRPPHMARGWGGMGNRAGLPGCQLPARGLDTHQCNPESRVLAPAPQGNNILGFHLFLSYPGPVPRRRPEDCGF